MFTIDDIVANLIAKTALSVEQQQQLRNILTSDNVLVAINTGILKAEELLSPATPLMPSSVLPISKISQLVAACDTALSNASIKEKKSLYYSGCAIIYLFIYIYYQLPTY